MAKDGNGTARWVAGGLFALIIVVLGSHLHGDEGLRDMVVDGAKRNAYQDATIAAMSDTIKRIETTVDRILERLSERGGG